MYKVGQDIETIQNEINTKLKKEKNYEALLYSVISFERMVRRTIKFMLMEAGYHSKFIDAFIIGKHSNWSDLNRLFKLGNLYLKKNDEGINDILSKPLWKLFDGKSGARDIRNNIAHGALPEEEVVKSASNNMLKIIKKWDSWTNDNLGYNGTQKIKRKSKLKISYPKKPKKTAKGGKK